VLAASTTDTDDALSRADHALYRAKRAGRDQVAIEPVEVIDPIGAALDETPPPVELEDLEAGDSED
jgi:hypothetical protein